MNRSTRYRVEVRERAIRMVVDHRHEYDSEWAAIRSIAGKLEMSAETLPLWVRRDEIDTGRKPGVTTEERERMKELERENRELRRAIRKRGPWRTLEDLEFATLEWVDWFNRRRLFEGIGSIPPAELEEMYYDQLSLSEGEGLKQMSLR